MSPYPLHELSPKEFEVLVTRICRKILGTGTTSFSEGRDGGKDSKFLGQANCFPSKQGPLDGHAVIQTKHTSNPTSSCSDNSFWKNKTSVLSGEIPKIKKQVEKELVTHYLLFTNRKKTGGAETEIPQRITSETGVKQAWLLGDQDIQNFLIDYPNIANDAGLNKLRSPIQFTPDDIRSVVSEFFKQKRQINHAFDSQYDFKNYPGIDKKNEINKLSGEYFDYIKKNSQALFNQIETFLKNPRNSELAEQYHAVADEFKGQLISHRNSFSNFDEVLEHLFQIIHTQSPDLRHASHRRLVKIFVHYMYCDCDIGKNT